MAGMKVNVDMSELDEAIERAHQLSAMLDEIEARFSDENILREAAAQHGYVLTPKMDNLRNPHDGNVQPIASCPTTPPPPKPKR